MKNLMISILVSVAALSAKAGIEFSTAVSADPLKIKLVAVDGCSGNQCYLSDEAGTIRLIVFTEINRYVIYNSKGNMISKQETEVVTKASEEQKRLASFAQNVTKSCPLMIEIDRTTLAIKKASLQCDPLASAASSLNAG